MAFRLGGVWWVTPSPEAVWEVISDLSSWQAWWPAIDGAEVLEGRDDVPERVRLIFRAPAPLHEFHVDVAVVEAEPPHRLVVASDRGGVQGRGEMLVESSGDGTTAVHYRWEVRATRPWLRPVETVLRRAVSGPGDDRLRRAGADLAGMAGGELADHEVHSP